MLSLSKFPSNENLTLQSLLLLLVWLNSEMIVSIYCPRHLIFYALIHEFGLNTTQNNCLSNPILNGVWNSHKLCYCVRQWDLAQLAPPSPVRARWGSEDVGSWPTRCLCNFPNMKSNISGKRISPCFYLLLNSANKDTKALSAHQISYQKFTLVPSLMWTWKRNLTLLWSLYKLLSHMLYELVCIQLSSLPFFSLNLRNHFPNQAWLKLKKYSIS